MREEIKGTFPLDVYPVKSGAAPVEGDMIAINASKEALPAADAAGITVAGVAICVKNDSVEVRDGVFAFANSVANALDRDDRGKLCYVEDKDTVCSVPGTNAVVAGVVVDVYNEDVYVDNSPAAIAAASGKNPIAAKVDALGAVTYVAPVGGEDADTEGRASLAQLATDNAANRTAINAILTALKNAKQMASA